MSSPPPASAATQACLKLHVFRVNEGLGSACALEFPDRSCGILDWGTEAEEPLEKVLELSRHRLRFVAATHAHEDHTLGLGLLLRRCSALGIKPERFFYTAFTSGFNDRKISFFEALRAVDELEIDSVPIGEDASESPPGERQPRTLAWAEDGSWDIRVLGPPWTRISSSQINSAIKEEEVPGNETSLIVLFRFLPSTPVLGMGRALLTGDATPAGLAYARKTAQGHGYNFENQLFLVPHHGSKRNFPLWLADYIRGLAVVSGSMESKHHPAPEVLGHLSDWTCGSTPKLFCTAYGHSCSQAFGKDAPERQAHLGQPGSCFGDIVVRLPAASPATLERSSADGESRRPFGYCGHPE